MARIVLGMWASHGPMLSTTPEQWLLRVPADLTVRHPFRGRDYDFQSLVEMRQHENLAMQSSLAERTRRSRSCAAAITRMAELFEETRPDVAVIMGNDQHELFLDELMPSIAVFNGSTIWDRPASPEQAARMPPGIHEAEAGYSPPAYSEYPGHPELAQYIIRTAIAGGFDVTISQKLPQHPDHWTSGIGHAFGFVYRRLMRDRVIPHVPVMFNTFFPPNQPPARRCFDFGQLVGRAIRDWSADVRVAVLGSGGMSHFAIDEALDQRVFSALRTRDAESLCSLDESLLQSGSSELKNWIAAAGALFDTTLHGDVVGYEACYRSEAGTGMANGFVCWR